MAEQQSKPESNTLGNIDLVLDRFPEMDQTFAEFKTPLFRSLPYRKRFKKINHALLTYIESAKEPAFLLAAVLDYISLVNKENLLEDRYTFRSFEFWLNQFSKLNKTDNYRIRGKIAGKFIPRDDYQAFFPIGMGKSYRGSHFVAAHLSPDIDTTIASMWGWLDAFAARVGEGMHIWYLPGGAPESHFSTLFGSLFGKDAFSLLAKQKGELSLTAQDLVTKRGVSKRPGHTLTGSLDHKADGKAILLVDQDGHWHGDWRGRDVESVRQVVTDFNACLRWFENSLHVRLISLFAKEKLSIKDLSPFAEAILESLIGSCEPALDFAERQRRHLHRYLIRIIGVEKGLDATFGDLIEALAKHSIEEFAFFKQMITDLYKTDLFDSQGKLKEDRPLIFEHLQKVIRTLDHAIGRGRDYVDRLDMMLALKHKVLQNSATHTSLQSSVEEIQEKIGKRDFLTVTVPHGDAQLFPVGIVDAEDLRTHPLGTVTLRDFSNEEETRMAPYLEVISIVDHHKISLQTTKPPLALIGDAQSSNVLIAEQSFLINDRYTTQNYKKQPTSDNLRIEKRRLTRMLAEQERGEYYVHPLREYTEYLFFLYAILDDTDLLAKVSKRDIVCTAELLNRMKSLRLQEEVEVIHFDDIPKDEGFTKKAARKLLQNPELHSLYQAVYDHRQECVQEQILSCSDELFADTKEQNGSARIGQLKAFAANFSTLDIQRDLIMQSWLEKNEATHNNYPKVDLYIYMISTISGAEEVYQGKEISYTHKDEIWITYEGKQGKEHLTRFLSSFHPTREVQQTQMSVSIQGKAAKEMAVVFKQSFPSVTITSIEEREQFAKPIARLCFSPGAINSRKAMISPHIPRA